MSSELPENREAYVEDFNEEDQVALPGTRQTASTTSTVNTVAKRSKSETGNSKALRDEFSDSGYSSHTAITLGSGDSSSLASKIDSAPSKPDDQSADSHSTVKNPESKPFLPSHSPEKHSLQRSASTKSKGYETVRTRKCECSKCLAKSARREPKAPDTPRRETTDASRSKPKKSSPTQPRLFQRTPRPYPPQEPVVIAAEPRRPKTPGVQAQQRTRPMSFHAGTIPEAFLMQHPMFIEQQPPPRYSNPSPFPPPSYPPALSFFPPPQLPPQPHNFYAPVPGPFDLQSQSLPPQRIRERPRSSRPQSMYYEPSRLAAFDYREPIYEAIEAPVPPYLERGQSRRRSRPPSQRIRGAEEINQDFKVMGPPPLPRSESKSRHEQQRPIIRHAATTTAAYLSSQPRGGGREREEEYSPRWSASRKQSFDEASRSRRPSLARVPRTSDEKVAQALQYEKDKVRMKNERELPMPQSRQRASTQGSDAFKDLEGSIEEVEAYQAAKGNTKGKSTATPQHDEVLRLTKKKTHASSSDVGSRASGRSRSSRDTGSDVKSRRRAIDDAKKQENENKGLDLHIPKGVQVNLQPGIEGCTVSLKSSHDGEGDISLRIGERGRTAAPRPTGRDKSRRRYSVVDGQAIMDSDVIPQMSRLLEASPEPDEGQRRIISERIVTTTRNRRESKGFSVPQEGDFF